MEAENMNGTTTSDDHAPTQNQGVLVKALQYVLDVNPDDVRQDVEALRRARPGDSTRALARRVVGRKALKAAAEGAATGAASHPAAMVPAAMIDLTYVLRSYAHMNAVVGYLRNPAFFDDPEWKDETLLLLAGPAAVARILMRAGVTAGRQLTKALIRKYVGKEVLRALKRFVLKWLGVKVTQRAIITKSVPFVGALIGGTWNWFEVKAFGKRVVRYHFEETLA
jgi:hypothetical protein